MLSTPNLTIFSERSPPWKAIGALLVAVLLAKWTWIFFAPATLITSPAKPDTVPSNSATLFGIATAAITPASTMSNVHLMGLFSGSKGFAILKIDGNRQLGVAIGEEISKGNKLVEIGPDFVTIENSGLRQRVMLENKVAANPKLADAKSLPASPQAAQAVAEWNQARQEMQNAKNVIP